MIEFNARFGDPETQVVLDRLASPLGPLLHAAATGGLAGVAQPQWRPGAAVVVVIAAEGYPEAPVKGDKIHFTERSVAPAAPTCCTRGRRGTLPGSWCRPGGGC